MSFFESSSIRVSEESRFLGLTARPPLAKNEHKHPSTGSALPSWGWIFSDPSRILCAGGPFSATPIAFCASECQKHMGKCSVAIFTPSCPSCWPSCPSCWPSWRQHVPQVLARCPKNAILEPTSPKKCLSHLFKHPKIPKNLCFAYVFVGFLLSSPCAKIVPKCSQHAPKTSQVEPKIAILALSWPILVATCCQLGPNFAHLAPIFAPTCGEIP